LPRERQRRFLDQTGWTAYSGPAIAELLEQFVAHNRMLDGGFVIDDRLVTLADIDLPVLTFVGSTDTIGHPDAVRLLLATAIDKDHVNRLGWTALLEAVILGDGGPVHTEIVRLLVEAGANVNIADRENVTPLQHAKRRGFGEMVRILESRLPATSATMMSASQRK